MPQNNLVCHVNLARGFRGGERQTGLLMQGLAQHDLKQRLIARRGEALAGHVADLAGLDLRQSGASPLSVLRHSSGAALLHVHEGRSVHAANLCHIVRKTPYVITRRVDNAIKRNAATRLA
ncbi:MAG: glycosyltransferase family 1 protein, partial [Gammaproteobacteria bacterium]|nr:glycosyltransferase family 1 protein [Gammaproteobacteria bacterium]